MPGWSHAEEDRVGQTEKLFREGLDLYQQGRYSEAQIKLRQVMLLEPRMELAARLVDEAGTKIMARMMSDPRMGAEPTRIWGLYRKYYILKLADKDRMGKMAARVVDPATSDIERAGLYREFAQLGHYAVPSLVPYLANRQHDEFRTYARVVIMRMGPVAVLPLIELLNHKEVLMRENAILTLHDIEPADERAIPALKARLEDPQESDTAKRYATRTLEKLTGLSVDAMKTAPTYYYESANRYYLERAGVSEEADMADGYIWHLNEAGALIAVQYPIWAWNEQMAEEQVLRGMSLHQDQTDFYPLAACIYAAQYTEVKDLVDIINENPTRHFMSEEERQSVLEWEKKLVDCRNLTAACGKYYVNEGLFKVHRDMRKYPAHAKLPGVGVFLARMLRDLDPRGELLRPPTLPIQPPPVAPTTAHAVPVLTSIEIVPPSAMLPVGATVLFKALAKDQFGKPLVNVAYRWFTEAGNNGSIDQNGQFTAGPIPGGPYPVYAQVLGGDESVVVKAEAKTDITPKPTAKNGDSWTMPVLPGHQPAPFSGEGDNAYGPGSALIVGLDSLDQSLQYACAASIGFINRFPHEWVGSEKVAALLGRGVSENQPVQVLVAEENQNVRNEIRARLEKLGYGVTDSASGRDAMLKARTFPPKDIVLISDRLRRDLTPEQLQEELRADVRSRYIPAGILHDRVQRTATQARFGTEILLVEREMDGNDLKVAIEKLEAKRAPESVPKRHSHEIAVECANCLAGINPNATNLNLLDAVKDALSALTNRKDDLRNPCATFLGNVRGGNLKEEVANKLLGLFQDTNNSDDTTDKDGKKLPASLWTRVNALKALCEVKPESYWDVYEKAQSDRSHVIQEWSAINFGKYPRKNGDLYQFLRNKRIDRDKKEK